MKTVFLTFGDSVKYRNSLQRIKNEAENSKWFDEVIICNETNLDLDFVNKYKLFMIYNRRGFGYWIWKPQIILQILQSLNDGDILVYCDTGCSLNMNGEKRFKEYIDLCLQSEHDNVGFELTHLEKTWTKGDLLHLYPSEFKETPQIISGIFFLKKSKKTVDLIQEWKDLMLSENFKYITDAPSILPNDPTFCENRHDQSCFSLIRKTRGCTIIKDETYDENWESDFIKDKPIHARRFRI
jgi:hypothetical protein